MRLMDHELVLHLQKFHMHGLLLIEITYRSEEAPIFRRSFVNIGNRCVVTFHYTLTNSDGEEMDSSAGRDPMKYLHGASNIVPGLEKELEGKSAGDKLKVEVQPEEGYGQVNPQMKLLEMKHKLVIHKPHIYNP